MVEEQLMGPLLVQLLPTPAMMAMCWWETVQGPVRPLEHGVGKSLTVLKVYSYRYTYVMCLGQNATMYIEVGIHI